MNLNNTVMAPQWTFMAAAQQQVKLQSAGSKKQFEPSVQTECEETSGRSLPDGVFQTLMSADRFPPEQ